MGADEINYEDLAEEPGQTAVPASFRQLLADGFPRGGGLKELAAIAGMQDSDTSIAAVRQGYRQILERQLRAGG